MKQEQTILEVKVNEEGEVFSTVDGDVGDVLTSFGILAWNAAILMGMTPRQFTRILRKSMKAVQDLIEESEVEGDGE